MKLFNKKVLSVTVSMFMTLSVCSSVSTTASDIDIYKDGSVGNASIVLMLDTSGSMGNGLLYYSTWGSTFTGDKITDSLQEDYDVCVDENGKRYSNDTNIKSQLKKIVLSDKTEVSYTRYYCRVNKSSADFSRLKNQCNSTESDSELRCFDRMTRLQDALIQVIQSSKLSGSKIGLGQYSSNTLTNPSKSNADGSTGRILVAAKLLTNEHRDDLIKAIVQLSPYGGTPTAHAYAETGAYMLGMTTKGRNSNTGSGFDKSNSTSDIKNSNNYKSPFDVLPSPKDECNGQGIYFLTDGSPNNSTNSQTLMARALGLGSSFSNNGGLPSGSSSGNQMSYVGAFSKYLRNTYNIKTAVVGFGKEFYVNPDEDEKKVVNERVIRILQNEKGEDRSYYNCALIDNHDAKNACNWGAKSHEKLLGVGGFGEGGFYSAQSSDDIIESIFNFVDEVRPEFDPVATGSPTIPIDSLNPVQIQPYGYYASFIPKPQEPFQLWLGNLNKYDIYNGELGKVTRDATGKPSSFARLITSTGALDQGIQGLWSGGAFEQLSLGATALQTSKRKIYTNREVDSDGNGINGDELKAINLTTLFDADDTKAPFKYDEHKNFWLNLLGYNVKADESALNLADLIKKPELRQLGSVMHSTPVLLTQEGKILYSNGQLTTTSRKDYLMYGSTQGLLHIVDSNTGKEVFSFVPNEMMEKQRNAFLEENSTTGGKAQLFYGIDAPWTAHTQYVTKKDGTLTVNDSERKLTEEDDSLNLKGMQWVYGGLRMGGRSYYALDLSDIAKPSFKFQIDPDADDASMALKQMGQSWSKPSLGYVKWDGEHKLVMFVGGGYDVEYEQELANPSISKGNGVYMFDAENGDLLWWSSATSAAGAEMQTIHADLQYSVVSQINAVDRDGDGLTDHLYFGDLGGQAFRVDFNNKSKTQDEFVKRVVTLFSEHKTGGKSPRFYEMPSVSIHLEDSAYFGAIAFSSGNRSSPLAADANSAQDGVFVVFDNDVARSNLLGSISLNTEKESLKLLTLKSGVPRRDAAGKFNGGWKYLYSGTGRYKGMNDLYALDNMLYVNVYDRDGDGVSGKCGSGVAGDSYLYQFCLPSGKCDFYSDATTLPNRVKLGAGILGTGFGQGFKNNANTVGLVVNRDDPTAIDCSLPANKNLPQCQLFDNKVSLKQLRWYESQ